MRPLNRSGAVFCACLVVLASAVASVGDAQTAAEPQGKSVTLRVGSGISIAKARSLARDLEEDGCPTTVTTAGSFPDKLVVEVGKESAKVKSVDSAQSAAQRWCLEAN